MTTPNNARTLKPDTIPVRHSDDPYTAEIRWIAACWLANVSKLSHAKIDEAGRSHSQNILRTAEQGLAHNCKLPLEVAKLALLMSLPKTRSDSKKLIAEHGDLLEQPEVFVDAYADSVVELAGLARDCVAGQVPFRLP